ncbi:MhmaT1 transposase [Oopsacas minuta]|uniref:MhmaT1 transposase n=1 Tax=Oopsacas minuta TaxID=111878 RepID=A0AAV7KDE4_9METZ|nr:MhmaT1 transposase [Oopsacas minuta]
MEVERAGIIWLFENGKAPGEILKLLNMPRSRRKFVYRTILRYKQTGGVKDNARSGRPSSVTTPRLAKRVRERIRRNPRRSMRKMAVDLQVSRHSIQNVVNTKMGMYSFKRKKVHHLTDQVKQKRMSRCKGLLERHEVTNSQNDRIISATRASIPEKYRYMSCIQKPHSVMVWAGVSATGRTPLIFVPPGVKINATTYRELILEPVLQNLGQTMFNGEPFIFQQDGAPAHTANSTQTWLQHNFPGFIQKTEWPPYSPDLNRWTLQFGPSWRPMLAPSLIPLSSV